MSRRSQSLRRVLAGAPALCVLGLLINACQPAVEESRTFTLLTLGEPYALAWSPGGDRLAVAAEAGLGIYDADLAETARLIDDVHFTSEVAWSPDGSQVAYTRVDGGGAVRSAAGDTLTTLTLPEAGDALILRPRVFSPDGALIAGEIQMVGQPVIEGVGIWEAKSGELAERRTPPLAAGQRVERVYDANWGDAGLMLLLGVEGETAGTYLWQVNGTLLRLEAVEAGQVVAAGGGRFSDGGRLISARLRDGQGAGIWRSDGVNAPQQVFSPALMGPVNALGESQLLFGGTDGRLQVWQTTRMRAFDDGGRSATLQLNTTRALAGAWQPGTNRFTVLGQDGVIRLYDGGTQTMVRALYAHARVDSLAWSPDGERITAWSNEPVDDVSVTFEAASGAVASGAEQALDPTQPIAPGSSAERIAWAADGSLAAWANPDGAGAIYRRGEAEPLIRLEGVYQGFAWSPTAATLAAVSPLAPAPIEVYLNVSMAGPEAVLRPRLPEGAGNALRAFAWNPDGTAFAAAVGQTELRVFLYSLLERQWSEIDFSQGVGAGPILLDWRAAGRLAISLPDTSPLVLDPQTGDIIFNADVSPGSVYADRDRYSGVRWNKDQTHFAGVAYEAGAWLRVLGDELAVVAEYGALNAPSGADQIPLRWSPVTPDGLVFLDGSRVLRWSR